MKLNTIVEGLQPSLIRTLKQEAKKYPNVIDLTIGEPDITPPKQLVDELMEYGKHNQLKYALSGGGSEVRQSVADFYNKKYGGNYTINNVVMNVGASEAISSTFRTILNPDDEVLVMTPYFLGYIPTIQLCYAKPIFVDISKNDFKITKELLQKYITPKTKAILFSNPCNPTGHVLSIEEMEDIVSIIEENEIFLVADEIYSELAFYEFHSFAKYNTIREKTIIINGLSKSHCMTGWRIGYTICPEKYIQNFLNMSFYTVSSVMSLSLKGAEVALKNYTDRSDLVEIYKERAEYLYTELTRLGFDVVKPKGAFYLFTKYDKISNLKSMEFSLDLLKNTGVAVVPGISFGLNEYIRIALTVDIEKLKEVIERLEKFITKK